MNKHQDFLSVRPDLELISLIAARHPKHASKAKNNFCDCCGTVLAIDDQRHPEKLCNDCVNQDVGALVTT